MPSPLPIDASLDSIVSTLRQHSTLVLRAPPGAGKTTRVPPAMLAAGVPQTGQILLLQPRRVAARAAAVRIAEERQSTLGDEVGYHVRFERRAGRNTRLLVATDGILLRRLYDDPLLEGVSAILFDEFHERNLNTELALAMVRRLQQTVRPELRIIVMSATLDAAPIARWLDDAPIIDSPGRTFPVEIEYLPHESRAPLPSILASAIESLFARTSGDILVFLPGVGEIRRTAVAIEVAAQRAGMDVAGLYADLPLEEQQRLLQPGPRRRIVLATNVAETSVTLPGVTAVVDSGWKREMRFDPTRGLNRLELTRIARAAAEQRAGRAGRVAPGICLRLWTIERQRQLALFDTPELERVDWAGPVLTLAAWGEPQIEALPWFQPPPAERLAQAWHLLERLGAVAGQRLTPLGAELARLPIHPRLARLVLAGAAWGQPRAAAEVAALLSERDPFQRRDGHEAPGLTHTTDSDVVERWLAWREGLANRGRNTTWGTLDRRGAQAISRVADDLLRSLPRTRSTVCEPLDEREAVCRALWLAFPDRLVRRREPGSRRGVMTGGRGVRQAESSGVIDSALFVAVEAAETGRSESRVVQASRVERDWLDPARLATQVEVSFDPTRERVVGWRRTRFEDLLLDEHPSAIPPEIDTSAVLAEAARERLDPRNIFSTEGLTWLERVRCLAQWMPEFDWPDWIADPWPSLWPLASRGCTSFDDLRRVPLSAAGSELLSPRHLQLLEREAPERWPVPSGSRIRLEYELGKPPRLSVRIQEVFGLRQTPRVAGGRVAVLMELLGPNGRPEQVTQDLENFWARTYHDVRKELRRRYPKHAWPEDPLTAQAERRPTRRRPAE